MNVCIATNVFYPNVGGIATYYNHLATILSESGHKVSILNIDYDSSPETDDLVETIDDITHITLRNSYHRLLKKYTPYFSPGGFDAPSWIACGLAMKNWLLKNQQLFKFDIIEVSDYGGLGAFLINNSLPPIVITGHGSLLQYSVFNHSKKDSHFKVVVELEKTAFNHANEILPYSFLNQQKLSELLRRKVGFATAPWKSELLNNRICSEENFPIVIAGFQKIKGAEILPQALKYLKEKKQYVNIQWVGADFYTAPPNGRSMIKYVKNKYPDLWNKEFNWKGEKNREVTIKLLSESVFVIIPSIYETFSYVALEAATLGKAIIITKGTGASYLFTNDHDALIIPEDNFTELGEAILKLSKNPALRKKLGDNAQKMILSVFEPKKLASERISIYKKTIELRKQDIITTTGYLTIIKKYTTMPRKLYFKIRKMAKKIIKGT